MPPRSDLVVKWSKEPGKEVEVDRLPGDRAKMGDNREDEINIKLRLRHLKMG